MTPSAASTPSSIWKRGAHEVSLVRMYTLRAVYLFFAVDGLLVTLPLLISHGPMERGRGLFLAVKGGLFVMGMIGVRYPLKMLPILVFEIVWKMIWLFFIGLPLWFAGTGSPRLPQDMFEVGLLPILIAPIFMPWGHIWRCYVRAPAERWR